MDRIIPIIIILILFLNAQAQEMSELSHIDPGSQYPDEFISYKNVLFFAANGEQGRELWRTDGTAEGTYLFKDLNLDYSSSPSNFIIMNGDLYFITGFGGNRPIWLWKSDGTPGNTVPIKQVGENAGTPCRPVVVGSTIYFGVSDGDYSYNLWKSDGTENGTILITNMHTTNIQFATNPFVSGNDVLYFSGESIEHGKELWKSDGTAEGTIIIKDIVPGSASSSPDFLIMMDNVLYFRARNSEDTQMALWRSDGTSAGTYIVKDLSGTILNILGLYVINSTICFQMVTSDNAIQLWRSDGSEGGTVMIKEIASNVTRHYIRQMKEFQGMLFFEYRDFDGGTELWKSDGTESGTTKVAEFLSDGIPRLVAKFVIVKDKLYFLVLDYESKNELWLTDGTTDGTVMISEGPNIREGYIWWNNEYSIATISSYIIFPGETSQYDFELWRAETEIIAGIEKPHKNLLSLQCFPNPAHDELSLRLDFQENIKSVEVYDVLGRMIQNISGMQNTIHLDIKGYTPGNYYVVVQGASRVYHSKFAKH